jgi:ElaB/YqjD/DUF883 family membrane-anchored ribosome-binding protein
MAAQNTSKTDRPVMDQIREKSSDVKQSLAEVGSAAKQIAQEQYEGVRDSVTSYYDQGRERAMEFEQSLEKRIRERPISAVLVATGLGFLLGMVWMRK